MKRGLNPRFVSALVFAVVAILVFALTQPARALPEYSAQTGEPCATCHVSPSGGGLRSPRGQGWLADHRPGVVPALTDALELLGVRLTVNEADFIAPTDAPQPAEPPTALAVDRAAFGQWLNHYEGN